MRTMAVSLIERALRPSRRSKNTLPLQTITRLTLSGLMSPPVPFAVDRLELALGEFGERATPIPCGAAGSWA